MHQQGSVLIHAVVAGVPAGVGIALVHVDVVDAVAGQKPEHFVPFSLLRAPTRAEGIQGDLWIAQSSLDKIAELFVEIVVLTRKIMWELAHLFAVEQVAPNVVERGTTGPALQWVKTCREFG